MCAEDISLGERKLFQEDGDLHDRVWLGIWLMEKWLKCVKINFSIRIKDVRLFVLIILPLECKERRIIGYLPIMAVNARDSAGTIRDKQGQTGTCMDKQGHSLSVAACPYPTCPCLSLSVHAFSYLSLSVPDCPSLTLSVPVCLYICYTFMSTPGDAYNSLHQYEHGYIDFPCKGHCSMHANIVFNFFFTFHLASSITLSFNPNSSILVINIA